MYNGKSGHLTIRCRPYPFASCPAGAISRSGIDYSLCLSDVTQRKGELTDQEQALVRQNGLMWGCDCCQNCCPYNEGLPLTYLQAFSSDVQPVVTFENLNPLCKTRAFGYKGKALLKRNLALIGVKPKDPAGD